MGQQVLLVEDDEAHVEMAGPDISLAANEALSLGLAIHELATNAAKYGALSVDGAKVVVTWRLLSPQTAEVHWREQGGPPVREPAQRGFGRDLIEKMVLDVTLAAVSLLRIHVEVADVDQGVSPRFFSPRHHVPE